MTVRTTQLVAPIQMGNADTAYWTTPVNTSARIDRAVFSNTTGGAVTITVNIVAQGGSSSAANQLINAYSIAAGTSYVSPELAGQVLPAGSMLRGLASAGASITMAVSGVTIV